LTLGLGTSATSQAIKSSGTGVDQATIEATYTQVFAVHHQIAIMALPGITDPEVRTLFTELRDEESEHIEMLREEMAKPPPSASVAAEYDPDDAPYL